MNSAYFYTWRSKFCGMDASMMARMEELEKENARLKRMCPDLHLRYGVLQEVLEKTGKVIPTRWDGPKYCFRT